MSLTEKVNNLNPTSAPQLLSAISDNTDLVSLSMTFKPKSIYDTTTVNENKMEGGKRKCRKMKKSKKRGGADISTTADMLKSIINSDYKSESATETSNLKLSDTVSSSSDSSSNSSSSEEPKSLSEKKEEKLPLEKGDNVPLETSTSSKLELSSLSDSSTDSISQKGGDDFSDESETDDLIDNLDDDDNDNDMVGGASDFNEFINQLFAKKSGGKKPHYSKEAIEYNKKTTEKIKSVYPNITDEEIKAIKSEIYQTIRAKYTPEKFKELKDFEKSKMLYKATTTEVIKKINIAEAVENRKRRIEEKFGKKEYSDVITPEKKESKKSNKKTEKKTSKKAKAKRGGCDCQKGGDDDEVELPFVLNGGDDESENNEFVY